jgi:epoxyqueuosine reductase
MEKEYFDTKIWPHMFYMSYKDIWKWKMNVARAMGNSLDDKYAPNLVKAYNENDEERVKIMCAWALGRLGGRESMKALNEFYITASGDLKSEIDDALQMCRA